jgi:hypothetical protein
VRKKETNEAVAAAKRRKNAAHGASRRSKVGNERAPKGRKKSFVTDSSAPEKVAKMDEVPEKRLSSHAHSERQRDTKSNAVSQ